MSVKEHYDNHLGNFYSWMAGDFESKANEFQNFLLHHSVLPVHSKRAIDLGAGHGIQSIPLAKLGFSVLAVDFNRQLLSELEEKGKGLKIKTLNDDIKNVKRFSNEDAEVILCCGDTISHLNDKSEIKALIHDIASMLNSGGKIILSFRDYSTELTGDNRFIPVKSDEYRILTCILDYGHDRVRVTDLLYERQEAGWQQKVSSYYKVRIRTTELVEILDSVGFEIQLNSIVSRMTTIIASKI